MNKIPTGVKIISIVYYITSVLGLLMGLLFFIGAGFIGVLLEQVPTLQVIGSGLFVVIGIIIIALSILGFFIGRGLWKGKNWARILAIIFTIIGIVLIISSMINGGGITGGIIQLGISAVIGGYLWFSQEVKKAFK